MTHSNNDDAADGDFDTDDKTPVESDSSSFEEQVNAAVTTMTQDDKGVWVVPEGLNPEVAFATKLEKRRRDTQSAYAKTSQELHATKTRADELEAKLKDAFKPVLTEVQADELDDLKSTDPEAYRQKMNEYEKSASDNFESELKSLGYDEDEISEMATRSVQLTEFLEANPGLKLDDEVLENDLPPRLTNKLDKGEITFDAFLIEAKQYLTKLANKDEDKDEPNLSNAGGDSKASKNSIEGDIETSYKDVVY